MDECAGYKKVEELRGVWVQASCSIFLRQPVGQLLTESLDRPDFDSSYGFFDRPHIYDQMTTFSRYHSPRGLLIKQGGHILLKRLSGSDVLTTQTYMFPIHI